MIAITTNNSISVNPRRLEDNRIANTSKRDREKIRTASVANQ